MTTLKEFCEAIDYKITEGSEYGWECFGPNARYLDSNGGNDSYSIHAIFDSVDQTVYAVEAWDYRNDRTYRWTNPDFEKKYRKESKKRDIDPDEAFDGVKYINLDMTEDLYEKVRAIVAGEEYDTRIKVPLDLPNEMIFELMKLAHEADLTLNQYTENMLRQAIDDGIFVKE